MNITIGQPSFGQRNKLQGFLVACLAVAGIAVLVGLSAWRVVDNGDSVPAAPALEPAVTVGRVAPTHHLIYVANSPEAAEAVTYATSQTEIDATANGSFAGVDAQVIDLSTPEGQVEYEAMTRSLDEAVALGFDASSIDIVFIGQ